MTDILCRTGVSRMLSLKGLHLIGREISENYVKKKNDKETYFTKEKLNEKVFFGQPK